MAELALGRGLSLPRDREAVRAWVIAHAELIALVTIVAIAAVLRIYDLGAKAYHHDESLHSTFSWYLYDGRKYLHDPLMHGPFQFHINALSFFLFGDNDFTARLPHALFGTGMVAMPYLLRKQIGVRAALIASVLLAVSPTVLYFSRFDREDIYTAFWTFAIVICLWRYLDEAKPIWLYGLGASLALSFATKETTFITAAIVLLFLDGMLAVELGRRRQGETVDGRMVVLRTLVLAPIAWLIAVSWPLLGKQPFGREKLTPAGDALVVVGTLCLPQFAAGIQILPFVGDKGYKVAAENNLRVTSVLVLMTASVYFGLLWRQKTWLIAAACFYVPFVLLYTSFFQNMPGFWSGIWGSLDYWLGQHHVRRGDQPDYYYALLTPLYEFLPLLLTIGGAAWITLKGKVLHRWLLFWLFGTFAGLSVAGEKMPWLETHLALPLILIAAVVLAAATEALELRAERWWTAAGLAVATGVAVLLLVDGGFELRLLGWILGATVLGCMLSSLRREGMQGLGRAALAVAVGALLTLSVRASITASFKHADTPVEMLVYTQTSHDIPNLMARIDTLAERSGMGYNLPIVVDTQDGYSWPWAWYLRHYKAVSYATPTEPGYEAPEGAVLLIHSANAANVPEDGYTKVPYKHRWWFNETYRELTFGKVASILTTPSKLEALGHFFLYRRPAEGTTGSVDGVAYFPDRLAAFDVAPVPAGPPAQPSVVADGRILIGRTGTGRGELRQPAGLFVDDQSNIWVADGRNNRVQKFDAQGQYVASFGRGGTGVGRFDEPWAVAVDADGFVYVADTWNHRIQKFSPSLEFVSAWGLPAVKPNPGPLELFGPRDILIDADGTLWVTDTGNKRLVHYTSKGEPLGVFGSEGSRLGEFSEPVGLARDGLGNIYVADTWNARIQRFDPDFTEPEAIETGWTSQEIIAKPYIAVLADGRILASEPAKGLLMLFSFEGAPLGTWKPSADSQPLGVAAMPDGGFVFSDAVRSEVQVVPGALVSALFR